MKLFWKVLPVIICFMLMAAHFGRANILLLQIVSLLIPFLLFWKSKLSAILLQGLLLLSGIEWIRTLILIAKERIEIGEDWQRSAIILGIVAILDFVTILVFRTKVMKERNKL